MAPTHEIFQKPYKIALQFEERTTPKGYQNWPGGEKLGETIKVWKLQNKNFPEVDPGLVSDPYGFTDSPDAEVISSGLNGKSPDSVAIGRHGNFFLWGFSAQPSDMTPDGQKCFVNSICYIKKFDGQKPLVRRTSRSREWALVYAGYLKGRSRGGDFIKQLFPEELIRQFGNDPDKYAKYYEENLEYLHPARTEVAVDEARRPGFAVDEDVKSLGVSNRRVELLDRCVVMLESEENPDLAFKLLHRYTDKRFEEAAEWRAWLTENRDRLFFTDVGGFKFMVAPNE